jgi:hypothetical protein
MKNSSYSVDTGDLISSVPTNRINLPELISEIQEDIGYLHPGDMVDIENELTRSQYGYIKFGLLLERIRNGCFWKACSEKFLDFKSFCISKTQITIWQCLNAIESAQVAVRLNSLGYSDLPRNASQALKMSKLTIEELDRVWGDVLTQNPDGKITANSIDWAIDPDKVPVSETIKIPAKLSEKWRQQASDRGLTLTEYLDQLVDDRIADDRYSEPVAVSMVEIVAETLNHIPSDIKSKPADRPAKKIAEVALGNFNDLMNGIIGDFIPSRKRKTATG